MSNPKSSPKDPELFSSEALGRYLVVAKVRAQQLAGRSLADAIEETACEGTLVPDGTRWRPKPRTIRTWLKLYDHGGGTVAALERKKPEAGPVSTVLTEGVLEYLRAERGRDARASVPELIRRARELGHLTQEAVLDRTSVWRALRRMGLPTPRARGKVHEDQRPWAYPHRGMMMLADGKHFRAGLERARRVACFYLDDATRLGLDVVVGPSESTRLFLRGLHGVVENHGLHDSIYLDHGPGFSADDTAAVIARMKRNLILGTKGYAEGHAKIERFHLTAYEQAIRGLAGNAAVDDDYRALELFLRHWLRDKYNRQPHEALGGQTPQQRWDADTRELRFPESPAELRRTFILTETRRVTRDNVIPIHRVNYEVPRGHRLEDITVVRYLLDDEVQVLHDGHLVRVHPVDLAKNAMDRRARPEVPGPQDTGIPTTAAALSFQREYGPIVDSDGGFEDRAINPNQEED